MASTGFRLDGVAAGDYSGRAVVFGGRYQWRRLRRTDRRGLICADPNGATSAIQGASYVVFGKAGGFASVINLSTLNGTTGFRLDGVAVD